MSSNRPSGSSAGRPGRNPGLHAWGLLSQIFARSRQQIGLRVQRAGTQEPGTLGSGRFDEAPHLVHSTGGRSPGTSPELPAPCDEVAVLTENWSQEVLMLNVRAICASAAGVATLALTMSATAAASVAPPVTPQSGWAVYWSADISAEVSTTVVVPQISCRNNPAGSCRTGQTGPTSSTTTTGPRHRPTSGPGRPCRPTAWADSGLRRGALPASHAQS